MFEKEGDWCHKHFISIPNYKRYHFSFKVIHTESNALSHPSLSHFYALLERFLWDAPRPFVPLVGLNVFKMVPLDDPHELGRGRKTKWSKIRWTGKMFKYSDVPLGQELLDAQNTQSRYYSYIPKSLKYCPFSWLAIQLKTVHTICLNRSMMPLVLHLIFHLHAHIFEPFVPLKNMCGRYAVISMHLLKYLRWLWRSFSSANQKLPIYSFLRTHSWTI